MTPSHTNPLNRGLSLSEVTITMAIVGGALVTLLGVMSTGLRFHLRAEEQAAATFIAANVFADLQLPLVETGASPDGEYQRFLDLRRGSAENGYDVFGDLFSQLTDDDNSNDNLPTTPALPGYAWVLDRDFVPVNRPLSSSQHLSDSQDLSSNGSGDIDGFYLVFVRTSDRVETGNGTSTTELDEDEVLVLVSVESPASAPPDVRRTFSFHRVLTVR
ncbi:MAG: hypothetical protein AAF491_09015 [Verrucomicrobiota bacterium]